MAQAGGCGAGGAGEPEPAELSLEAVLKAYEQPINEEQAWAVCFQGCRGLRGAPGSGRRIRDTADIVLRRDGSVGARPAEDAAGGDGGKEGAAESATMVGSPASSEAQMVQSLGFAIYRALDWGLDENEERELSPQLERLIDLMANNDCEDSDEDGCGGADEGYVAAEEEEEGAEVPRMVRTFAQAMRLCALRLSDPRGAHAHYQAVCRALFVETLELQAFLARVRDAKEMLQKLREEDSQAEKPLAELDHLGHTDWTRLWVQLMRELRHGVKLKKVQEQEFNPLPTEFQLTPFEMLMQDIRARNYKLRKVMVNGDIPPRVKKDAHDLILDFIRSRPPLKQVSERRLRPLPQKQRSLHEKILEEIKQERQLRPVGARGFGSLPCILNACSGALKASSCINLSVPDAGGSALRPRPRVLLKAPTLAEMEEMTTSEEEESPCVEGTLKRDRSFSEHDLAQLRTELASGHQLAALPTDAHQPLRPRAGSAHSWRPSTQERCKCPRAHFPALTHLPAPLSFLLLIGLFGTEVLRQGVGCLPCMWPTPLRALPPGSFPRPEPSSQPCSSQSTTEDRPRACTTSDASHQWLEFSHPVESLALTVEEVMEVRRVLVKAEMEKFLHNKELVSSLKKGKVCCCCRTKFSLFSWPPNCLFCKRAMCGSCSVKMKMPSKKLAHIPVYALGFDGPPRGSATKAMPMLRREVFQSLQGPQWQSVEEEFPHLYTHGGVLKDVCNDCTSFVADVVCSSRKSVDALNATPRRARQTQSLYIPSTWMLDFK
ncbi:protein spire homolog 2 [Suncus etruscus]|uniref:protein spire homolog 2 n=1 Tax=Suncus etruscus TaxID=109475 RepID=UPI0021109A6C|nr:protein spire homolog 2 [Suncus etruscus]